MSWHGAAKNELLKKGAANEERAGLYDPSFMANLIPALPYLEKKGIKLASTIEYNPYCETNIISMTAL